MRVLVFGDTIVMQSMTSDDVLVCTQNLQHTKFKCSGDIIAYNNDQRILVTTKGIWAKSGLLLDVNLRLMLDDADGQWFVTEQNELCALEGDRTPLDVQFICVGSQVAPNRLLLIA